MKDAKNSEHQNMLPATLNWTLKRILVHLKDTIDSLKQNGVVYGISCSSCEELYVG